MVELKNRAKESTICLFCRCCPKQERLGRRAEAIVSSVLEDSSLVCSLCILSIRAKHVSRSCLVRSPILSSNSAVLSLMSIRHDKSASIGGISFFAWITVFGSQSSLGAHSGLYKVGGFLIVCFVSVCYFIVLFWKCVIMRETEMGNVAVWRRIFFLPDSGDDEERH